MSEAMKLLINGQKRDASDGKTIDVINPVNNELLGTVPSATKDDIDDALNAAREGYLEWKEVPLREKEVIFKRFFKLFEENKRELVNTLVKESGCSVRNALMQCKGVPELFNGYLESAKRHDGRIFVPGTEAGHDGRTEKDLQLLVHEPLGTIVAITPFNAPLMLSAYKTAPALATGNAVIVKPPTTNPMTVLKAFALLWEAGVPGGALQVLTGNGEVIGNHLVSDARVDAVGLTGSTEVGINVNQIMGRRLAPCALELGGNDPFIIFDDADLEAAIKEASFWRMNSAGQICISPKRFIVHNKVKDAFIKGAVEFTKTIIMGYDVDFDKEIEKYFSTSFADMPQSGMVMNSIISEKAAIEVESQINHTLSQGATLVVGGKRHGTFIEPTIISDVTPDMDVMKDMEIFGPVMPVCGFDTVEEAIEIANASKYGLSGCVFTKDWQKGLKVARAVQSGGVVVNGTGTYRNMMHPFGGYKMSGVGREGFITLDSVTQQKVIILKDIYQ